jgi:hypothetical protein
MTASLPPLSRSTSPLAPALSSQTTRAIFIGFRELMSVRGNALLRLLVQYGMTGPLS